MRKEVNRYRCRGEDGSEYTVIERQTFTNFRPMSGPSQNVGGALDWILSDGRDVNFVDDDTFQILDTDEVIRKID